MIQAASSAASRWLAAFALVAALPVAAWVFYEAQRHVRADLPSAGARKAVGEWVSGERRLPSRRALQGARGDIERAVQVQPDNPDLQEALGDAYLVAGQIDWADREARRPHFERAVAQYRKAIALRPGDAQTWAALAGAYAALGAVGPPLNEAWERALALGPNEAYVQPLLMQTALAVWPHATPQMQEWATQFFENGEESRRRAINKMAAPYGLKFDSDKPPAK